MKKTVKSYYTNVMLCMMEEEMEERSDLCPTDGREGGHETD